MTKTTPTATRGTSRRTLALVGLLSTGALLATLAGTHTPEAINTDTNGTATGAPSKTPTTGVPTAPDGATATYAVPHGPANAAAVVTIYEDFACPYCAQLEEYAGTSLSDLADDNKIRIEHQPIAILDFTSTTDYSSRAANAYAAVLHTAGAEPARTFRTMLFVNQPAENTAGLSDDDLIEIAVIAGATKPDVAPLIRDRAFKTWVKDATAAAAKANIVETPGVFINGKKVKDPFDGSLPKTLDKILGGGVLTR